MLQSCDGQILFDESNQVALGFRNNRERTKPLDEIFRVFVTQLLWLSRSSWESRSMFNLNLLAGCSRWQVDRLSGAVKYQLGLREFVHRCSYLGPVDWSRFRRELILAADECQLSLGEGAGRLLGGRLGHPMLVSFNSTFVFSWRLLRGFGFPHFRYCQGERGEQRGLIE